MNKQLKNGLYFSAKSFLQTIGYEDTLKDKPVKDVDEKFHIANANSMNILLEAADPKHERKLRTFKTVQMGASIRSVSKMNPRPRDLAKL